MQERQDLDWVCSCSVARKAARYLTAVYDRALAPAGLRVTQFMMLNKVARTGPTTIKQLAADMAMDRTTLASNFKPLERDGLVWMRPGEDRREKLVEITPKGEDLRQKAVPLWERAQLDFEGRYGGVQAEVLRVGLRRVLDMGFDPWAD